MQSWKFGCCPLTLRNSLLQIYGGTNHSTSNDQLWLVPTYVYEGGFLKVNGQQPNFQDLLCLHPLPPLWNFISNYPDQNVCSLWFP